MTSVEQITGLGNNGLQRVILPPINNPSNNSYSYQGNNIIQFALPNSMVMADFSTLRLSGSLRFTNNAGMTQGDSGEWTKIFQDPYLGINSVFRSLEFSSTGGNRQSIEKVQNYNQMLQTILPALNSTSNYVTDLGINNLASQNIVFGSKFFMQNASYFKDTASGGDNTAFGIRFSTPLYSGLTMATGQKIPLGLLNGVTVTLELQADNAVFCSTAVTSAEQNRIKYELFDLKLECELYSPTAEERVALMNQKQGVLQCNTFTSLFSVVQSSQANVSFNLGTKELVSALFKFCPTNSVNNLGANEYQSSRIISAGNETQQFTRVRFQRAGVEFPLFFPINVVSGSIEAQLNKYYLQALKNVHTKKDPRLCNDLLTNDPRWAIGATDNKFTLANQVKYQNKLNQVYGIGYDFFSSMTGADFDGKPWSVTLDSNLSDARTNAMYAFVLAKTDIMFNENGVMVVS